MRAFTEALTPPSGTLSRSMDGLGTRHPSFAAQTLVSLVRPDLFLAGEGRKQRGPHPPFGDPLPASGRGAQDTECLDPLSAVMFRDSTWPLW